MTTWTLHLFRHLNVIYIKRSTKWLFPNFETFFFKVWETFSDRYGNATASIPARKRKKRVERRGGGQDRRRKKSWNSHGIFFFLVSIAVKVFSFTDNKTTSWIGGDKIINRRNRDDEKSPSVRRNNQNVEPNFFNKVPFPNFSIEVKKKKNRKYSTKRRWKWRIQRQLLRATRRSFDKTWEEK